MVADFDTKHSVSFDEIASGQNINFEVYVLVLDLYNSLIDLDDNSVIVFSSDQSYASSVAFIKASGGIYTIDRIRFTS